MKKKVALLCLAAATLIFLVGFSTVDSNNQSLACSACENGVVDKAPCDAFTVKITFKNTGKTEGTWSINTAFEDKAWTWSGTAQTLTLKPSQSKTLSWNGSVPSDAPVDSLARLIVYHNDSSTRLNWWIHVVPGAELTITSSIVQ